tara:strand:- start:941 stop:1234 length:294 start_codon:yes stop_codon:yes gene_type:complete
MSVAVGKRFGDTKVENTNKFSMPSMNNFHTDRYGSDFTSGVGAGKPVVDIYKFSGYDDPRIYKTSMRGMDDRNKLQTADSIARKLKDTTALMQRSFQ